MPALIGLQLFLLLIAHIMGDFYAAFYGPLVPHLRDQLGLSLTMTSVMATVYVATSNFMQPVFGALGERLGRRRMMACGVLCAAIGMSALTMPGWLGLPRGAAFIFLVAALLSGGAGIGMFHPSGAAISGSLAGGGNSRAIAVYMVGGNIGVMLAPLVLPYLVKWRPETIMLLAIPGIVTALTLWLRLAPDAPAAGERRPLHPAHFWHVLAKVWPIHLDVILRFTPMNAYFVLLPLYGTLCGYSLVRSSQMLAVVMFAGGAGMMVGGFLAHRFSGRTAVACSELVAGLCLLAAPAVRLLPVQAVLLFVGGFLVYALTPQQVASAQRLARDDASAASGMVMGLAYGNAGLLLIPLGMIGDHLGAKLNSERIALQYVLQLSAVTLFLAAALTMLLKAPKEESADARRKLQA